MNIGDIVTASLGNLRFGGKIIQKIVTTNHFTKETKATYIIELPCGLYIESNEL